ncbi:hypothetical protein PSACC_03336 [Paramicrosporidium saccamoebae]|uniref:protein-tyrosine-phosphatase n=1 Tax=Paramicrosporidium saccamoebae TaxID=1246581 RepID=A0A2H9TGN4_9FUNG|nr:hypothetical protein PSACC_03336 [Paramicrosporidium saccamoebae]
MDSEEALRSQSPTSSVPSEASARVSSFSSAHHMHHHGTMSKLPNPPTLVKWEGMRFVIMDAPSDGNIDLYLRELKKHGVTEIVRVCDPTYSRERVEQQGIRVHEMLFPDGDAPPDSIVSAWMTLVETTFKEGSHDAIAVHCVAGLGRAPVLVAIALIEAGMSPLDAVSFLRERRRGAINNKQLRYLESYRRRSSSGSQRCAVM